MKTATERCAQGDLFFRRIPSVPKGAKKIRRKGPIVVGHSETGHHHVVEDPIVNHFEAPGNPLVCYLQLGDGGGVNVVHQRAWDTHETVRLLGNPGDVWEVRRQREWTPEGWQRVAD